MDRNVVEVTINIAPEFDFRLAVPRDETSLLRQLMCPASLADSALTRSYLLLEDRIFTGSLAVFDSVERMALMRFVNLTARGTALGHDEFKSVDYLAIGLPDGGETWDDLQVNRNRRVGKVISVQFPLLKSFVRLGIRHDSIGGLRLECPCRHGTAPNYDDASDDTIVVYFPLAAMIQFADADITSQQLLDQSIVLVNGDRVSVDLTAQ